MAEQRCPMCSKPNPEDLESCQFCGARLKPLIASPSAQDQGAMAADDRPTPQDDAVGWLRSLGEDKDQLDDIEDDLPGWLGEAGDQVDEPDEEDGEAESASDWLSQMRSDEKIVDTGELGEDEPDDETDEDLEAGFPEIVKPFAELPSEDRLAGPDSIESDQPNWLEEFTDELSAEEEPALPQDSADDSRLESVSSPTDEGLDWLDTLDEEEQEEDLEPLPDWLTEGKSSITSTSTEEELDWLEPQVSEEESEQESSPLPDWLGEEREVPSPKPEEDVPDWLESPGEEPSPLDYDEDVPDWLTGSETQFQPTEEDLPESPERTDHEMAPSQEDESVPDWLSDLPEISAEIEPEPEILDESLEAWEREKIPSPFDSLDDFEEVDFPSGSDLDGLSLGEEQEEVDAELAPGALPDWLQAMRPDEGKEIVATEYVEGEAERVGPLVGLRGLLAGEPDVVRVGKIPVYSSKLRITDTQRENVRLFRELIETEGETEEIERDIAVSPQRVLRIIIAIGLFLAIGLPILVRSQIISLPPRPPLSENVTQMFNSLTGDQPVLLAFEYEPGLSGELDASAAAIIDQLILLKGSKLALVSTSPIGPAVGERFISTIQREHNYQHGDQYINLGYIPGGATGLQNFALAPKRSTSQVYDDRQIWAIFDTADGNPWVHPLLESVNTLEDFAMTIVITDDPDTARNWIEQVQPALRENSLIIVVSAQAEPMVRPYFESPNHQVSGLITGLAGGAAYEQDRPKLARIYWDAFGISTVMTLLLILAGGAYNFIVVIRDENGVIR